MPNEIANNMADTIHFLEEDNASMMKSLTNLQFAYNEQMIELREAKRLLRLAVDDANSEAESLCAFCKHNDLVDGCPYIENYSECEYIWRYTDEAEKLLNQ